MAYVKLAPLVVFLFATYLMFPMKKVGAEDCSDACSTFGDVPPCLSLGCFCFATTLFGGYCLPPLEPPMKMIEKHPHLCQSHADCMRKGSGSFCARYPNPYIEYGWCFASNSEANNIFKIVSNTEAKSFVKMPMTIAT